MALYAFNDKDNEDETILWRKKRVRLGFKLWLILFVAQFAVGWIIGLVTHSG